MDATCMIVLGIQNTCISDNTVHGSLITIVLLLHLSLYCSIRNPPILMHLLWRFENLPAIPTYRIFFSFSIEVFIYS